MATDGDAEAGAGAAAGLRRELETPPVEGDGIVAAHDPLLLVTENLLEIDAPTSTNALAGSAGAQLNVALCRGRSDRAR